MNKLTKFFVRLKESRKKAAKARYKSMLQRMYNVKKYGQYLFVMCDGEPVFKCAPEMSAKEIIAKVTQMQHDKETYDKIHEEYILK